MNAAFARRIQGYYTLCVVGFLLQCAVCLGIFANVAAPLVPLLDEMSLKLPLPSQLLLLFVKARLPYTSAALLLACGYLGVAYHFRPRLCQGDLCLNSTYAVTVVQLLPMLFLIALTCACCMPSLQLIGTLG